VKASVLCVGRNAAARSLNFPSPPRVYNVRADYHSGIPAVLLSRLCRFAPSASVISLPALDRAPPSPASITHPDRSITLATIPVIN